MSVFDALQYPFTNNKFVNQDGRLSPEGINWFNQLVQTVNLIFKSGRDTLGAGATTQLNIYMLNAPNYTSTQRDSMTGLTNGLIIYNTTVNKFQGYAGGVWVDFH